MFEEAIQVKNMRDGTCKMKIDCTWMMELGTVRFRK